VTAVVDVDQQRKARRPSLTSSTDSAASPAVSLHPTPPDPSTDTSPPFERFARRRCSQSYIELIEWAPAGSDAYSTDKNRFRQARARVSAKL